MPLLNNSVITRKFVHFNARSIVNKWDIIVAKLSTIKPDVIAISETWITPCSDIHLFVFENYVPFFNSRVDSRGGGTLLLINLGLPAQPTIISSEFSAINAYYINAATMSIGDNKIHVATVYRPPWTSIDDLTSLILDISRLIQPSVSFISFGDFNLPRINWFDTCKTPCDGLHNKFQTFVDQNCLSQLSFRTRSDATLDLVQVSDDNYMRRRVLSAASNSQLRS